MLMLVLMRMRMLMLIYKEEVYKYKHLRVHFSVINPNRISHFPPFKIIFQLCMLAVPPVKKVQQEQQQEIASNDTAETVPDAEASAIPQEPAPDADDDVMTVEEAVAAAQKVEADKVSAELPSTETATDSPPDDDDSTSSPAVEVPDAAVPTATTTTTTEIPDTNDHDTDESPTEDPKPSVPEIAIAPSPVQAPVPTSSSLPPGVPTGVPVGIPVSLNTAPESAPASSHSHSHSQPQLQSSQSEMQSLTEKQDIPVQYVGRIIGKGGEQIRDLQARSSCKVDVDQNVPHGAPRVITYHGTKDRIDFAKNLVNLLCQENWKNVELPLGFASRAVIQVPGTVIGKIIGRGGEMIKVSSICFCLN
jgi:predicted RNA-binding protein YlqC (UPF0109 family)